MVQAGAAGPAVGPKTSRHATSVNSLDALVGAHPDALRDMYLAGRPADPAELGDAPAGRVLALDRLDTMFLAVRPAIRSMKSALFPWKGKTFDHGGNSGQNRIFGRTTLRFRTEVGPSVLDGAPTLILHYDRAPWPIRGLRDELRMVAPGVAIGPVFSNEGASGRPVFWFGLEAS